MAISRVIIPPTWAIVMVSLLITPLRSELPVNSKL